MLLRLVLKGDLLLFYLIKFLTFIISSWWSLISLFSWSTSSSLTIFLTRYMSLLSSSNYLYYSLLYLFFCIISCLLCFSYSIKFLFFDISFCLFDWILCWFLSFMSTECVLFDYYKLNIFYIFFSWPIIEAFFILNASYYDFDSCYLSISCF